MEYIARKYTIKFVLLRVFPFLLWLTIFRLAQLIPANHRPEIDVKTIATLNSFFFGWFETLIRIKSETLIFIAAFPYLFHFAIPWLFMIFTFFTKEKPFNFLWSLGLLNISAVVTHVLFPTAPPWYTSKNGFLQANYASKGDAALLTFIDTFFNIGLFDSVYTNSPIVFGSFPSLHVAWPFLIALHTKRLNYFKWFYILWINWAAIYLEHHYTLDVLGGMLYALLAHNIANLYFYNYKKSIAEEE
eukprot:TRINITY_DN907_c0_g1_i1.p1 TRINITY_DN907_c0_g1~~TRINITY_DN907_c0_g1_i1.p1  ORF type:complete len:262 (-),score=91.70 TRINITY_DN907_c0_g1_i1:212-946(-)